MGNNEAGLWNTFMETGEIPVQVDPIIRRSWERCRKYEVNHNKVEKNELLSPARLRETIQENRQLVEAATPIMEDLFMCLRGLGFMVILADARGYLLKCFTDDDFSSHARKVMLCEGANWSERFKGTNAIGTSLAENQPVTVFATEHYVRENHILACAAVPIKGPGGKTLGTLDVTGESGKGSDRVFCMVKMAAQNIEREMRLRDIQTRFNLSRAKYEGLVELMREGAVMIDEDGIVREMNQSACKILGLKKEECLGENIEELFNLNNLWVIESATSHTRELTVSTKNGSALVNTRTKRIYGPDGSPQGMVAIVNPEDKSASEVTGKKSGRGLPERGNVVRYTFDQIIGQSKYLQQVISICKRVAKNDSTVLLQGETGTGKEMLAQAIHQESSRRNGPFVAVNCAAIPPELVESELFGYEEGAFTGARKGGKPGKFELADKGTIFLDEIGDMPLQAQVSLLRALQEKQFFRVGGQESKTVDARVIVATHRNLAQMVEEGAFRQDLYFRLNVVNIFIPPLRARKDDIPLLVNAFLDKYRAKVGRPELKLLPETLEILQGYSWPGNIRELENVIEGLVNVVEGEEITPRDLPENIGNRQKEKAAAAKTGTLQELEKEAIKKAIVDCGGSISAAAARLNIGRSTIYRKIREYNIDIKALIG